MVRSITPLGARLLVCVALLLAVVPAAASPPAVASETTVSDRIINGDATSIGDVAWQVAIVAAIDHDEDPGTPDVLTRPFCGGSLIDPQWVVSAAHCFDPPVPSKLYIVAGVTVLSDLYTPGNDTPADVTAPNLVPIATVSQHADWDDDTNVNDIALLRLTTPVDLAATGAAPIDLPWAQDPGTWPTAGAVGTISGWGDTDPGEGQNFPPELRGGTITIGGPLDPECGTFGDRYQGSAMLCAGDVEGLVDTCQGDSGGPLATPGNGGPTLAGITSFGKGCANGIDPGVYARVTNYLAWIDGIADLAPAWWTASIVGVQPARLYESRPGLRTVDGQQQTSQRVPAGSVAEVIVAGRGNVPADAVAAQVNVIAVRPDAAGFLTVFPCTTSPQPPAGRPGSSTLNYPAGDVVANGALVRIGVGGRVCVYSHQTTDLVLDVTGFVPLGAAAVGLQPSRLLETRPGEPAVDDVPPTVGGRAVTRGRIPAGWTIEVQVAGRGGVPVDAAAAWVNVTAVRPDQQGFVTLFPCGATRPTASTLNYPAGGTVANGALVQLGTDGRVCIYTHRTSHLILDVTGFLPSMSPVTGVVPARLLETRVGNPTVDGQLAGFGRVPARATVPIRVAGRAGVPAEATAVTVNVVAIGAAANGFITLYPCDRARPDASTLNFSAGEVVANGAFVPLSADGSICLYTHQATDAVLDVTGWAPA